jgi:hypothetical protein
MVTQSDVDTLKAELETLRSTLMRDREQARLRMGAVIGRAQSMRDAAAGGKFEPAVTSVHDLLLSLRCSLEAQAALQRCKPS